MPYINVFHRRHENPMDAVHQVVDVVEKRLEEGDLEVISMSHSVVYEPATNSYFAQVLLVARHKE